MAKVTKFMILDSYARYCKHLAYALKDSWIVENRTIITAHSRIFYFDYEVEAEGRVYRYRTIWAERVT
jgi:hypothetical protein